MNRLGLMLAQISAHFVRLAADQVDGAIEEAQRLLCEKLGLDRSALWQTSTEDPDVMLITHLYQNSVGLLVTKPAEGGAQPDGDWIPAATGSSSAIRADLSGDILSMGLPAASAWRNGHCAEDRRSAGRSRPRPGELPPRRDQVHCDRPVVHVREAARLCDFRVDAREPDLARGPREAVPVCR